MSILMLKSLGILFFIMFIYYSLMRFAAHDHRESVGIAAIATGVTVITVIILIILVEGD